MKCTTKWPKGHRKDAAKVQGQSTRPKDKVKRHSQRTRLKGRMKGANMVERWQACLMSGQSIMLI